MSKNLFKLQKELQELCDLLINTGAGISPLDRVRIPLDEQVPEAELKRQACATGFDQILLLVVKILAIDLLCYLQNHHHFHFIASNHPARTIGTNDLRAKTVGDWSHKSRIQKYESIVDQSAPSEILIEWNSLMSRYPESF